MHKLYRQFPYSGNNIKSDIQDPKQPSGKLSRLLGNGTNKSQLEGMKQ